MSTPGVDRSGANYAAAVPPPDYSSRAAADLGKRLDKAERALKSAIDARDAAVKEKQDTLKQKQELEFQLHSTALTGFKIRAGALREGQGGTRRSPGPI